MASLHKRPFVQRLYLSYRYSSAFIAARIMALDDTRKTPAHTRNDGHTYHPTHRLVTLLPLAFVSITTLTAGVLSVRDNF